MDAIILDFWMTNMTSIHSLNLSGFANKFFNKIKEK
jgi:hypothetical protein